MHVKSLRVKARVKIYTRVFLRGFFMEIRHIARNLRACKCCNARGLYCTVVILVPHHSEITVHVTSLTFTVLKLGKSLKH